MLAASCTRQQQANSIDQAPAAWDELPWPGMGMSTQLYCVLHTRDGKAKEQTGCIEIELGYTRNM